MKRLEGVTERLKGEEGARGCVWETKTRGSKMFKLKRFIGSFLIKLCRYHDVTLEIAVSLLQLYIHDRKLSESFTTSIASISPSLHSNKHDGLSTCKLVNLS